MDFNKHAKFNELINRVHSCMLCPRMCNSVRVLNGSAGNIDAEIMFIGEAPGRLGADSTEIPFHGDKTGHNFEELLEFSAIPRSQIFVTNAVLCNPKDSKGNNATPIEREIANCSRFLREQIDLVDPKIVVTLGATALHAAALLENHDLTLRRGVRTVNNWYGRKLIPLYHPGQRAMIHRSFANQRSDYQFVAEILKRIGRPAKRISGKTSDTIAFFVRTILSEKGNVSYFGIHKLFYLLEYTAVRKTGNRLTNAYFIRQKDGPYCTDLHLAKLAKAIPELKTTNKNGKLILSLGGSAPDDLFLSSKKSNLNGLSILSDILNLVMTRYNYENDTELKRAVYLTAPMRQILAIEKNHSVNLYNSPIRFMEAT